MNILEEFGIDEDDFQWQDLALCRQLPEDLLSGEDNCFFDKYEADRVVAKQIDEFCLTCPVISACAEHAQNSEESGVWGGIYWNRGKIDRNKNNHKSQEVRKRIKNETGINI